jgi:hypothetical protein
MIQSRRVRWAGQVAGMGRRGMHIGYWLDKLEGNRPPRRPRRPRRRWVNNIKIDLKEKEWDGMDWIDLAQHRDQWRALMNPMMNLRVP